MELYPLKVFLTVATERSFSRAGEKLLRTQPAISLAVQRLENELGEKLLDRTGRELTLTDAGKIVIDYCRRFENLEEELTSSIAELRDLASGRLVIGANESTCLYLIHHIVNYRRLYPKVKVQVRRTLSSKLPAQIIDGDLELGVVSYDPDDGRLSTHVIYDDHLCFVVSPQHRFAGRERVGIQELGMETFIAHNVMSPYREHVIKAFQKARVRLNMDVEMPTVETIRMMVQRNEGVAFLPKMCVESELNQGLLCEIRVEELQVERKIRLIYPSRRNLSHAAQAFLEVVDGVNQERAE
ncbi:MAG: LysR family transcriptional regulator [Candidatus Solibacter sp.]|nr:LysR family transcriptional regulator [Candidatus Solibacter sp.]